MKKIVRHTQTHKRGSLNHATHNDDHTVKIKTCWSRRTTSVQLSYGSLNHATHNDDHISLPPSPLFEPRHPPFKKTCFQEQLERAICFQLSRGTRTTLERLTTQSTHTNHTKHTTNTPTHQHNTETPTTPHTQTLLHTRPETHKHTGEHTHAQAHRQTQTHRQTETQTNRQPASEPASQTDGQTDRQTDRHNSTKTKITKNRVKKKQNMFSFFILFFFVLVEL